MSDHRRPRFVRARLPRVALAAVLVAVAALSGRAAVASRDRDEIAGPAAAADTSLLADVPPEVIPLPPLVDGPDRAPDLELPTEEAGTHRTWFAAGTWWAVLPDPVTGAHRIWGLSGPDGPWIDSGTLVDERPFARIEAVWDGQDLVVAAAGTRDYRSHALRVHRFSWRAEERAWVPAADHPIEVTAEGEPLARTAVTADGTAWLVRPRGAGLEVARTAGRAARWVGWEPLSIAGAPDDVGGFDLLATGDEVVVVWRRLAADAVVVARRRGETWTRSEVPVPGIRGLGPVDASSAPGGGPLAVLVTTTAEDGAAGDQAPSHLLAVVPPEGPGGDAPVVSMVARGSDGLQRASVLVDGDQARVFAIAPPTLEEVASWYARGGGQTAPSALVEKVAPLADPLFTPGAGRRLIGGVDGEALARPLLPSSLGEGGIVAVASGGAATRWSTWVEGVAPAPETPPSAAADAVTVLVDDTFDSLPVDGPGPTSWAPEDRDPPVGVVIADPALPSRALRLDGGPEPVSACRPIPELPAAVITVEATVRAVGTGTADARLLTIRGSGGSVASVRLSRHGLAGWSTSRGRATGLPAPPGAVLALSVRLDLAARTTAITVRTAAGAVLAEGEGIPWLTDEGDGRLDELCVRPAPGDGTAVVVDCVRVTQRSG